jgi:hypothetical protein
MRFALDEPGSARLEFHALPPGMANSRNYLDGMAAAVAAGFDFVGVKGEVRIEALDPAAARATLRLEWDEDADGEATLPVPARA